MQAFRSLSPQSGMTDPLGNPQEGTLPAPAEKESHNFLGQWLQGCFLKDKALKQGGQVFQA